MQRNNKKWNLQVAQLTMYSSNYLTLTMTSNKSYNLPVCESNIFWVHQRLWLKDVLKSKHIMTAKIQTYGNICYDTTYNQTKKCKLNKSSNFKSEKVLNKLSLTAYDTNM